MMTSGGARRGRRHRAQVALDALGGPQDRLLVAPLDVRSEEEARTAAAAAVETFGRIDVLVNNAGRGLFGAVEQTTLDDARTLFDTNVLGVLAVTRAVLPVMRAQRSGRIVMMSSMGGFSSGAGFGMYAADYLAAADAVEQYEDGDPPGDTEAVAAAVLDVADQPHPPLRLPIGEDAVSPIRAKADAVLAGLRGSEWAQPGR